MPATSEAITVESAYIGVTNEILWFKMKHNSINLSTLKNLNLRNMYTFKNRF